jgi:two-component system, chemotaxis family, CheB/CheR fusion protein
MVRKRTKAAARAGDRAPRSRARLPGVAQPLTGRRPPVIGIGASAGGIDAVSHLLRRVPADTGLAFVIIQHLAPRRPSQLSALLARTTAMTVVEAEDGTRPAANHVYVIPPGVEMVLRDGRLAITATERARRPPRSIDLFFGSLAEEERGQAIAVLLSGTGSDGTDGLRAIRAQGGIALVEDPASARFPGMPESAIAAGAADRVLGVDELADELVELSRTAVLRNLDPTGVHPDPLDGEDDLLSEIFALVRGASGVDFSEYKATTFRRRLARRMLVRRMATPADYRELLRDEPDEVIALGRDILIHVTEFFRDPAAFDVLAAQVVPHILERHDDGTPIRIWVPGCSTGEEVYSIAICLLEALGDGAKRIPIQIFGTDLSAEMIERARAGTYPDAAVRGLGEERLHRFFTHSDAGYCVGKAIRSLCVFVKHDLTRDPPFVRLDLVSCRNVLIYFSASLQRRVVPLFHYCLNPGGFLMLGHAEAIAGFRGLFDTVDKASKLFRKIGDSRGMAASLAMWQQVIDSGGTGGRSPLPFLPSDLQRQADSVILSRYAPPGALVDERLDVIHLRGQTALFLELGPGHPNLGILKLARPGLRPALRSALEQARKQMTTVRREGVEVRDGDRVLRVAIEVIPVSAAPGRERHFLVLFEQPRAPVRRAAHGRGGTRRVAQGEIDRLREEAESTRDYLQSLLDERQRMNDEVTAANEELVASNEELQSSNEELESAKEELQSANEELTTLNDEMQVRNQEVNQVNSDLVNLLASVDLPLVIVGGDRRVRRFTPGAKVLMNLIPSDLGRPIDDIKLNVQADSLDGHITEVLETLQIKELEVVDRAGHWHRLQIRPYRTVDGRLDGAVISLTDIDRLKQAAGHAAAALDQMSAILDTIRVPLVVLDQSFAVRSANPAYYDTYGGDPSRTIGQLWFESCDRAWDSPALREALAAALAGDGDAALEIELECPPDSPRTIAVSASVLRWASDAPLILITSVDVTERIRLVEKAEEARSQAVRASISKDVFLATLSHELRGPLHTIALHTDLLLAGAAGDPDRARSSGQAIARAAEGLERIIGDLLDVSAIVAGKVSLKRKPVDLRGVVGAALDAVRSAATRKRVDLSFEHDGVTTVVGDETRLLQVVGNLVGNAVKFTPTGGTVAVELEQTDGTARIRVSDSGQGIAPDFLPHVFDRFVQADGSNARAHGGLGLGLAIVRDLVRLHGGNVRAESDGPGTGAAFTVELPSAPRRAARPDTEGDEDTDPSGHHRIAIGHPLAGEADLSGLRVLLVDDDAGSRQVLSEMLSIRGAEVRAVPSASAALAALGEGVPDVLLCDIVMPDEDGYSLIRRIRSLPAAQGGQVPAVAVTALATRSDRKRALAAGFQLHLAKPAPVAALCDALRRARGESVAAIRPPD